jgi:cytochrome P450
MAAVASQLRTMQERRGIPILGLAPEIQKRGGLVPILQEIHREQVSHGLPAICKLLVAGNTLIYLGEPDLIGEMFHQPTTFDKPGKLYYPLRDFMVDHGLISAPHEQWKVQRQHARGIFAGRFMQDYSEIISTVAGEIIMQHLDNAKPGEPIDMDVLLGRATSLALVRCMFNVDSGERPISEDDLNVIVEKLDIAFNYSFAAFFTPPFMRVMIRGMKKEYDAACQEVRAILTDTVRRYMDYIDRNAIAAPWDIISSFIINGLNAPDPKDRITFEEVCGNVLSFVVAGFDTTKSLIKTNLRCLWQYPGERQKVMNEIVSVLGTKSPSFADLSKMPVLDQFVDEALRYECPTSSPIREAVEDTTLGGYPIAKGTLILLCQHIAHHDERFWSNPEVFDSSRFAREPKDPSNPFAYFPFTEGDRKCIGMGFAKMEAKIMTVQILQGGWSWTVTNPDAEGTHASTFQRPQTLQFERNRPGWLIL